MLQTKSELCNYDVNLRFCLALQSMGVGEEHARIVASFLDLLESQKWPNNFRMLENFFHNTTEELKHDSQQKVTDEEIILTNVPSSKIEQTLVEHELPRYQVEASYNMGWQVRFSGGKFRSSTGHGLLSGALSMKVLDSTVFNKKYVKCIKNKNNTKPHNCMKN